MAKENPRAIIVALSPGWVKTGQWAPLDFWPRSELKKLILIRADMGGPSAQIEVADSVRPMLKLLQTLKPEESGLFLNREGKPLPY